MIKIKISSVVLKLIILIILSVNCALTMPTDSTQSQQTEVNEEVMVTAYPDAQKRFVDLNYVSPEVSHLLQRSNLNVQQIREQQEKLKARNAQFGSVYVPLEPTDSGFSNRRPTTPFSLPTYRTSSSQNSSPINHRATSEEDIENMRLMRIQSALQATLRQNNNRDNSNHPSNQDEKAEFDYAFGAVCEIPRGVEISEWFHTKSWSLLFKPVYQQYNVKSVMLRVYKVKRDESSSRDECNTNVDEMLTITVSAYIKRRRILTKKIIFSTMIEKNYNGWIEIDAKGTLKFWEKARLNYGLAVDVYDEDDNQLDAREFFELQDCEADTPIPWRSFKLLASQDGGDSNTRSTIESGFKHMSTLPRLDLISSTAAAYQSESQYKRHIRHAEHRDLYTKHNRNKHNKSTVTIFSNKIRNEESDHLHRENSQEEET